MLAGVTESEKPHGGGGDMEASVGAQQNNTRDETSLYNFAENNKRSLASHKNMSFFFPT